MKMTEGRKMLLSVMTIFVGYTLTFIIFDDYDRHKIQPLGDVTDWHLLLFSIIVLIGLAFILKRYAARMDERISREQAEKEGRMRRELTQNISHELKTPVASILGYTETILDTPNMDDATRLQFMERTHTQAQRLTALLQDLSILNRMDYAANMITKERVNVSHLFADIVQETALDREHRRMTLHNALPQNIIIQGNPSLLYSIFRNLTDNAINYAGEGCRIDIQAKDEGAHWRFIFSDNGAGIPPEHLERIFERFYRIDKSRSRSLGGTGLGLSIVKNAVILHGGSITVRSLGERGLAFIFTLKKK